MQSFRDLLKPDVPAANDSWKTSVGLEAAIVGMHPLTNCRTGESYIIGGADDGSISVWDQMWVVTIGRTKGANRLPSLWNYQVLNPACSVDHFHGAAQKNHSSHGGKYWSPTGMLSLRVTRWNDCCHCRRRFRAVSSKFFISRRLCLAFSQALSHSGLGCETATPMSW